MSLEPGTKVYRCHIPNPLYGIAERLEKPETEIVVRRQDGVTEAPAGWYPMPKGLRRWK